MIPSILLSLFIKHSIEPSLVDAKTLNDLDKFFLVIP